MVDVTHFIEFILMYVLMHVKIFKNLFKRQNYREWERQIICCFALQMAVAARAGPGHSTSLVFYLGFPREW